MKARRYVFVGLLVVLVLAACGGDGGGDEPVDVVKKAFEALEKLDTDEAAKYVCEAQKDQFAGSFDFASDLVGELPGIDPERVSEAVKLSLDVTYEEQSQEGDTAVVIQDGTMTLEIDKEKLEPILQEAGIPDDQVELAMSFVDILAGQEVPISEEIQLIKEDGEWVLCPED